MNPLQKGHSGYARPHQFRDDLTDINHPRLAAGTSTRKRMAKRKDSKVVNLTDLGTKEARSHGEIAYDERSTTEGRAVHARRMRPCERLHRWKMIDREHADAAERLTDDWYTAGLMPSTTVNLFGVRGGPRDYTPTQLAARERSNKAMRAAGPESSDIIYRVCCLEATVSDLECDMGWRRGVGMVVLKMALGRLAVHYGYLMEKPVATGR